VPSAHVNCVAWWVTLGHPCNLRTPNDRACLVADPRKADATEAQRESRRAVDGTWYGIATRLMCFQRQTFSTKRPVGGCSPTQPWTDYRLREVHSVSPGYLEHSCNQPTCILGTCTPSSQCCCNSTATPALHTTPFINMLQHPALPTVNNCLCSADDLHGRNVTLHTPPACTRCNQHN
jgi:hypothetical protein